MKNYLKNIDRRNTNCYKWDSVENNEDLIPLWVADMDFAAPKPIVEAVIKRAKHPAYGYVKVPKKYYEIVCEWFANKHGWNFEPKDIIYTSGVIPALSATVSALATEKQSVVVMTPVYNHFFSSIRNNGVEIIECPLIYDGETYTIDYKLFEKICIKKCVRMFILCNPHNPVGRVWSVDELRKLAKICKTNNVFVLSDEIHCEIMMPGQKFNSFGPVGDEMECNYAVTNSPSKTFNTASLQISNIICKDKYYRDKIEKAINVHENCDVNPFGIEALMVGYTDRECKLYIESLGETIQKNYDFVKSILYSKTEIKTVKLEGTYLMWINISCMNKKSSEIAKELLSEYNVWMTEGTLYGEAGEGFLRINLATSHENLEEGMKRFMMYYNKTMNQQ